LNFLAKKQCFGLQKFGQKINLVTEGGKRARSITTPQQTLQTLTVKTYLYMEEKDD